MNHYSGQPRSISPNGEIVVLVVTNNYLTGLTAHSIVQTYAWCNETSQTLAGEFSDSTEEPIAAIFLNQL